MNNVPDAGDNAHPSGKDRSVEHGASGNQGKSESDPDDDGNGPDRSNGGYDKPNGTGGLDEADQDGNNGCGNDDDFEDDNEGWCGHHPKPNSPAVTITGTPVAAVAAAGGTRVLGVSFSRGGPRTPGAAVAGSTMTRASSGGALGGVLPFTGAGSIWYLVAAAGLLAGGSALLAGTRSRRI